jgi:hypothetical protein
MGDFHEILLVMKNEAWKKPSFSKETRFLLTEKDRADGLKL